MRSWLRWRRIFLQICRGGISSLKDVEMSEGRISAGRRRRADGKPFRSVGRGCVVVVGVMLCVFLA